MFSKSQRRRARCDGWGLEAQAAGAALADWCGPGVGMVLSCRRACAVPRGRVQPGRGCRCCSARTATAVASLAAALTVKEGTVESRLPGRVVVPARPARGFRYRDPASPPARPPDSRLSSVLHCLSTLAASIHKESGPLHAAGSARSCVLLLPAVTSQRTHRHTPTTARPVRNPASAKPPSPNSHTQPRCRRPCRRRCPDFTSSWSFCVVIRALRPRFATPFFAVPPEPTAKSR